MFGLTTIVAQRLCGDCAVYDLNGARYLERGAFCAVARRARELPRPERLKRRRGSAASPPPPLLSSATRQKSNCLSKRTRYRILMEKTGQLENSLLKVIFFAKNFAVGFRSS
ncbi:unnamed protein product, partial [Iphiclides podalirius]